MASNTTPKEHATEYEEHTVVGSMVTAVPEPDEKVLSVTLTATTRYSPLARTPSAPRVKLLLATISCGTFCCVGKSLRHMRV